ncbi:MAG: peptidoglycan-associated lipoprotein Pal [Gammaproteobacteria bacterium]|nr:peptidoglycan-associated lipoprotein Pal [Gammaproteobacteria bacterium]
MTKHWLRSLFVIMLAGLVFAGCATTSETPEPTEPVEVDVEEPPPPPPPEPPEPPQDQNDEGIPVYLGTNRLLPRTFYFDYDRAVIDPDDLSALEMHATFLNNHRDRSIVLEGHCDERGTREYNLALGENRANAVSTFLTSAGVYSRQIETVSYGEERPADPGHSDSAWTRNRRAVMNYR